MKNFSMVAIAHLILVVALASAQTTLTPAPIPEEARKHFVMGETMFKEAKAPGDFVLAEGEFKQATDLAPQWPDVRYNLALAKEAAGDYTGAMADLKLYQQFKLTDSEARAAQDKIYAIEAKQKMAVDAANSPVAQKERLLKSLDGGVWKTAPYPTGAFTAIKISRNMFQLYSNPGRGYYPGDGIYDRDIGNYFQTSKPIDLTSELQNQSLDVAVMTSDDRNQFINSNGPIHFDISRDLQTITMTGTGYSGRFSQTFTRIK